MGLVMKLTFNMLEVTKLIVRVLHVCGVKLRKVPIVTHLLHFWRLGSYRNVLFFISRAEKVEVVVFH